MKLEYQILLRISSLIFIMMSVSEGIPATNSSNSSELDVHEPVQTRKKTHGNGVTVFHINYDQSVTNRRQNCSSSSAYPNTISLKLDVAEPSVLTHPAFTECRELLKRIEVFHLTDSTLEENQNLFSNLPHLKQLVLNELDISRLTKDFFSGLPELEYLSVGGSIQNIDADTFTGMPNLKSLALEQISLEESHLDSMKNLSNLEELTIQGSYISNLNALKGLTKLEHLYLISDAMPRFNVTELKKNLPNLRRVDLNRNPFDLAFKKELQKDELFHIFNPQDMTLY